MARAILDGLDLLLTDPSDLDRTARDLAAQAGLTDEELEDLLAAIREARRRVREATETMMDTIRHLGRVPPSAVADPPGASAPPNA